MNADFSGFFPGSHLISNTLGQFTLYSPFQIIRIIAAFRQKKKVILFLFSDLFG